MNILFITHYDNLYGANNAMLSLIAKLKERENMNVTVVVPTSGQLSTYLEEMGASVIIVPITAWQATFVSPLSFLYKLIKRRNAIKRELEQIQVKLKGTKIDLIHSNSSVIGHGAMLAKSLGCKHIWHIREFAKEHFSMRYFYSKSLVKKYYENADCLIAISEAIKANYKLKYPNARIIRAYDGVDEKIRYTRAPKEDNIIQFAYVGYLYKKKHQLEVIDACEKLYEANCTNFVMHIVGDGKDDYKKKLISRIKEYPNCNVRLEGYVSNVNEFLSHMDVGVIASEYEGFGLVTVEYMLSGLPVIGYNHSGTSEIVKDHETGILYNSQDELVYSMKKLMSDSQLRLRLGKNGYERAKRYFTEDANGKAVLAIYDEILGACNDNN